MFHKERLVTHIRSVYIPPLSTALVFFHYCNTHDYVLIFSRDGVVVETHFCVLINGHLYQVAPSKAVGFDILKIPLFYLTCLLLLMAKGTFSMLTYSTGDKGPEAGKAFYTQIYLLFPWSGFLKR